MFLKIRSREWKGFTGPIGRFQFENGVSAENLSRADADMLAVSMEFDEVDESGKVLGPAGVANRLISESANRAPVKEPLNHQTEAEQKAEKKRRNLANKKAPTDNFYTLEQLEKIASKGIKPLREIAEPWDVRNRSIPKLIQEILEAQAEYADRLENDGKTHTPTEQDQQTAQLAAALEPAAIASIDIAPAELAVPVTKTSLNVVAKEGETGAINFGQMTTTPVKDQD